MDDPDDESAGVEAAGAEPASVESAGFEAAGAESAGAESAGFETAGVEAAVAASASAESAGFETAGVETAGFEPARFADDIPGDEVGAHEVARLRAIRAGLIEEAAVVAASEARRLRLLAEAAQIAQARMLRATRADGRERQLELRSIALELGLAVRVNDRTMQGHLDEAERMLRLFPATVDALQEGRIDRGHAAAILDAGRVLAADDGVRAAFEQTVIEHAGCDTPARTRAFARKLAERVHPTAIDERFAQATLERRVTVTEIDDGMARLEALLPAAEAFGIFDRLTRGAKAIQEATTVQRRDRRLTAAPPVGHVGPTIDDDACDEVTDERSRDQIRADLFTDLLLTGAPAIDPTLHRSPGGIGAIRGQVQITVPVTTLTGATTGGAELDGRAPVDAATAKRLAGDAPGWDRVMTDPVKGTVHEVDRYEPTAAQRRYIDSRDIHCRTPGCRQPIRHAQLDHNHERRHGGRTRLDNLSGLCIRHHTLKTETGWTVTQLTDGTLEWTSPLGYAYLDDPPTRVVFLPEPDSSAAPF